MAPFFFIHVPTVGIRDVKSFIRRRIRKLRQSRIGEDFPKPEGIPTQGDLYPV